MQNREDYEPVLFRGKSYRASKYDAGINPHFFSADEAYEKVEKYFKRIGITRLANITGLDRIGIPAVNAIRPNHEGFSLHHGKGLTLEAAKVSAAMEAVERWHGEKAVDLPSFRHTYRELSKEYNVISPDKLALSKHSLFDVDTSERWILGWDIINQEEVAVPFGLVSLQDLDDPFELRSFQTSSNGLAGGTDFLESVSQALLEVIERDGITCHSMASRKAGSRFPLKRVRLETIEYPEVRELLEQIESRDVLPLLFDCEVDTKIPVYNCYLLDRLLPHEGICHGMGASLDPATAMVRAVTEAALARAVFHSGARDTFYRDQFYFHRLYNNKGLVRDLGDEESTVDTSNRRSEATTTFEGDIRLCVEKLKNVGIEQVIVLDITQPGFELYAVKVIVPGLEGYMHPYYSPGQRAREYSDGKEI
jgi:ribosomal protein S12 methylthiotransferase accessory factor